MKKRLIKKKLNSKHRYMVKILIKFRHLIESRPITKNQIIKVLEISSKYRIPLINIHTYKGRLIWDSKTIAKIVLDSGKKLTIESFMETKEQLMREEYFYERQLGI